MVEDDEDADDLEERLDRLEETLEELRDAVVEGEPTDRGGRRAAERALRLTERLAVPAAVAALEANVRVLEFLRDRLEAVEAGGPARGGSRPVPATERMLDRLDEALVRMEEAVAEAGLPRDAEARRLLERARDLNEEVRDRTASSRGADEPTVIEIDVEEELDRIRDDVEDEDDG